MTFPLRDICARLADRMSPADHYAAAEKHSKYDEGFAGSGVTFCAAVLETFSGLSTKSMTLFKTVIGRAASRVALHCAGQFKALCWQRLSCSLRRSVANAILARIPKCDEELT